jgi:hypothetical protein
LSLPLKTPLEMQACGHPRHLRSNLPATLRHNWHKHW